MYRAIANTRKKGLRGFTGQPRPRFPFGLGGLRGFTGQPRPRFPFGLGCSSCGGRKTLGQDDSLADWASGSYSGDQQGGSSPDDTALLADWASGNYSGAGVNYPSSTPVAAPSSSGVITIPGATMASIPIFGATGTSVPGSPPSAIAPVTTNSYWPLIALGAGGLILILVAKRR
jgi:hypothetical protein